MLQGRGACGSYCGGRGGGGAPRPALFMLRPARVCLFVVLALYAREALQGLVLAPSGPWPGTVLRPASAAAVQLLLLLYLPLQFWRAIQPWLPLLSLSARRCATHCVLCPCAWRQPCCLTLAVPHRCRASTRGRSQWRASMRPRRPHRTGQRRTRCRATWCALSAAVLPTRVLCSAPADTQARVHGSRDASCGRISAGCSSPELMPVRSSQCSTRCCASHVLGGVSAGELEMHSTP